MTQPDVVRTATVVAHYGVAVAVRLDSGALERVRLPRRTSLVVGDRVEIRGETLVRVEVSRGVLKRRDSHGRIRSVASNLDCLGIVLAPRPDSPVGFVDRGLVAAGAAGLSAFIVVNKSDLPGAAELHGTLEETYGAEVSALLVSSVSGAGLNTLRSRLAAAGRGVFVGTSGVGKSSLFNALLPELELAVGEINEVSGLGRHVTSTATLHALPGGGEWIDTPGFRDFGPVEVSPAQLAAFFPGFESVLEGGCHFRDCLHRSEPGCCVLEGVGTGLIAAHRHAAYLSLLRELEDVLTSRSGGPK
jgi:ribosome biogenesis GTPase